jgi:hypothetical protein
MVLGFKLRAPHLWGWCSTLAFGLVIPIPFCFSYFSVRVSHFLSRPASDYDPHISGDTCMYHHTQFVGWDRVSITFLPGLALNCDPPNLCFPSRWDYSMFYHTRPHMGVLKLTLLVSGLPFKWTACSSCIVGVLCRKPARKWFSVYVRNVLFWMGI